MQVLEAPAARSAVRWVAPVLGAIAVGAAIGLSSHQALVVVGLASAGLLFAVPISWVIYLSMAASLLFRLATPYETGVLSVIPDAMIGVLVLRAAADWGIHEKAELPRGIRWMLYPLVGVALIAAASMLVNHDQPLALLYSLRQFLRYPVWAVAAAMSGLTTRDARRIVVIIAVGSLIQFPLAYHQYRTLGAGDAVSGTFGHGGSGVMMIYLVMAAGLWLALALERAIPWWSLWFAGPALVLPMGWGSAATFVVLLPLALFGVFLRFLIVRHGGLRLEVVLALVFILGLGAWAARSYAVAPPCAGCRAQSATALFHDKYLSQYYAISLNQGPVSRLGFLAFAFHVDAHSGPGGALFGQGPSASFIGQASAGGLKLSLSEFAAEAANSVESLQRFLLGYGFLSTVLYLLVLGMPVLPFLRRSHRAEGPQAKALIVAAPMAAAIVALAGPYTASWSDPGVAAGFWGIVVAAHVFTAGGIPPAEARERRSS